ncbi:hypothetical protein FKM82_003377 [Ascaphus truei]
MAKEVSDPLSHPPPRITPNAVPPALLPLSSIWWEGGGSWYQAEGSPMTQQRAAITPAAVTMATTELVMGLREGREEEGRNSRGRERKKWGGGREREGQKGDEEEKKGRWSERKGQEGN